MASTKSKFAVSTHAGKDYEVEADRIEIDPVNSNRVTFFKGDDQVAQENDMMSVHPA